MKKIAYLMLLTLFILTMAGCSVDEGVFVYYGKSEIYSREDIDAAMNIVRAEFDTWEGCELHSLVYKGDEVSADNLDYCRKLGSGADFSECIVFESSFRSPKENSGAWEPNEEYTGYSWYLAREKGGEWVLLTCGYA